MAVKIDTQDGWTLYASSPEDFPLHEDWCLNDTLRDAAH